MNQLLAWNQESIFRNWLVPVLAGTIVAIFLLAVYYYFRSGTQRSTSNQIGKRRNLFSKFVYFAFLLTTLVLAFTSFGSILQKGVMHHYALLAHLAASGAFVFLLFLLAVIYLPRSMRWSQTWWLESTSAWILVLSGLVVVATILFSMLPIADTQGLLQLAELHRFAGLLVVASAAFHAFSMGLQWLGKR